MSLSGSAVSPASLIAQDPPESTILTVGREIPAPDKDGSTDITWEAGVSELPVDPVVPFSWETCHEYEEEEEPILKEVSSEAPKNTFLPWMGYVPDGCSTSSIKYEDYEARAEAALELGTAYLLSEELEFATKSGSPSLASTALDITPATGAVSPVDAVKLLTKARLDRRFSGQPILHIPSFYIYDLYEASIAERISPGIIATRGKEALISTGPGYHGIAPLTLNDDTVELDGVTAGTVAADGTTWFYISPRVEYRLGPVEDVLNGDEASAHRRNSDEILVEREMIYRFDYDIRSGKENIFAILVDVSA